MAASGEHGFDQRRRVGADPGGVAAQALRRPLGKRRWAGGMCLGVVLWPRSVAADVAGDPPALVEDLDGGGADARSSSVLTSAKTARYSRGRRSGRGNRDRDGSAAIRQRRKLPPAGL